MTLYKKRKAMELDEGGGWYSKHVMAMTAESLHNKSDIACELAYRDKRIAELERELEEEQGHTDGAQEFDGLTAVVKYRRKDWAGKWINMAAFDIFDVAEKYAKRCSSDTSPWEYEVKALKEPAEDA